MKKQNFLDITDFCEKYSLNKNSFESMKARKYFPEHIFKKDGRQVYVDENYFVLKKEAIKRMWLLACENFYDITCSISASELSKRLHKIDDSKSIETWNTFLYGKLFITPSEKITHVKMTRGQYLFLRYSNWILKRGARG